MAFYLRPDVVVEPLFNQWYLRLWLVAPANAALNLANQVRLMRAYLDEVYEENIAHDGSKLLNEKVIGYDRSRAKEIEHLLRETEEKRGHLLALADAIKQTDNLVVEVGNGYSLEPAHQRIPEILRGFVELEYDNNSYARMRVIEGLLYKSRFYDRSAQAVQISRVQIDQRPFVMSTPRLLEPGTVQVALPIESEKLDRLSAARMSPVESPAGLAAELGLGKSDTDTFAGFFSEKAPPQGSAYDGPGMRVRYYGHSTLLIEWRGVSILTDPGVGPYVEGATDRFSAADLPQHIDYAVVTHGHWDHLNFECLLQLRNRIGTIVVPRSSGGNLADPSLKLALENTGFRRVVALDEMESIPLPDGEIMGIPFLGEHSDQDMRSKLLYLVRHRDHKVLVAADTRVFEPGVYRHVHAHIGDIDVLFVSMEVVGVPMMFAAQHYLGKRALEPLLADKEMRESRRYSNSNTAQLNGLIDALKPKAVYVYSMALEPWMRHILGIKAAIEDSDTMMRSKMFVEDLRARGFTSERLFMKKELFFG